MTAGTIYTAAVMIVAGLGFHGSVALHDPVVLTLPLATMLAVTRMNAVLRESDTDHRGAAVLDALTGMLNRTALVTRTAEIEHQSRMSGRPVGVIVGDVDHFKAINDRFGHETGDAVLRHIAYQLHGQLRAFDLAYRLGGEEFAIILLGADAAAAALLAEQLRAAIAEAPIAAVPVTMSFGVAASTAEVPFVWEDVFRRADRALYRAKAEGRDAVRVADGGDEGYPGVEMSKSDAGSDPVLPHAA
jgi:diguanylate cyclase (GGDEF)-like protein